MDSWSTHKWLTPETLRLNIYGQWIRQRSCRACQRDFVELLESGEHYAGHKWGLDFDRLADKVTNRWLSQPCPGKPVAADAKDRKTLFASPRGRVVQTRVKREHEIRQSPASVPAIAGSTVGGRAGS